jgi:hypothetical protein
MFSMLSFERNKEQPDVYSPFDKFNYKVSIRITQTSSVIIVAVSCTGNLMTNIAWRPIRTSNFTEKSVTEATVDHCSRSKYMIV